MVDRQVMCQREKPPFKAVARIKLMNTFHYPQPGQLKEILGRLRLANKAQQVSIHAVLVALHKRSHGLDISSAEPRQFALKTHHWSPVRFLKTGHDKPGCYTGECRKRIQAHLCAFVSVR